MKDYLISSVLVAILILSAMAFPLQPKEGVSVSQRTLTQEYYDIEWHNTKEGIDFRINNPCVKISHGSGSSMKPFWEEEVLDIVDSCFPFEKLEVGDVITFKREFEKRYVTHRIIEINYDDGWVRTKGDNNNLRDDIKSSEYIYGKIIGVLNVLGDKKEVLKPELESITTNGSIFIENGSMGDLSFIEGNMSFIGIAKPENCINITAHWREDNDICFGRRGCWDYMKICLPEDYWLEVAEILEDLAYGE